jgi:protein involved in gliding motility SprA
MRMFLTDFEQQTVLRFGTLQLVRGDWRVYDQDLTSGAKMGNGSIDISTVNIEENSERKPVNYVLPPGLSRSLDPDQTQLTKENEQSLSMRVTNLDPEDARAIYKNTSYDLRRYKRIQLFTHAENLINRTELANGDISVFMRLGSDYKNNYYEYEIPLTITPEGNYGNGDRAVVWPKDNMFDFPLELTRKIIKLNRNKKKKKVGLNGILYNAIS